MGAPNLLRIVFDPAGLGVDLGEFLLRLGHDSSVSVKNNAAGAGGALVQGKQIGHGAALNRKMG